MSDFTSPVSQSPSPSPFDSRAWEPGQAPPFELASGAPPARDRLWLHIGLFFLTAAATTVAGAAFYAQFITDFGRHPYSGRLWTLLPGGLWFSVPAMLILGCHEMGHYLACRYYGIRSSMPYFIPMPPAIPIPGVGWAAISFGTLGAVIRIREPIRARRVLFDMAIAGPLGGLAIALPALFFALLASRIVPLTAKEGEVLGEPLAFQLAAAWIFGPIKDGLALNLHPSGFAAWFGMLLTGLNLIPAGQLDGGHVAYACLGRHSRWLTALSCLTALVAGVMLTPAWLVWLLFMGVMLSTFGWQHAPVMDEHAPLGAARWALALLAVLMLVLCIIPVPFQ